MPDVDTTLRTIAPWHYMIKTAFTQAFYQIPLSLSFLKYCRVATPFCGIPGIHEISDGMPGSETALEEMMCCILRNFIQEGCMAKLADDLYCGGDTLEALLNNWRQVLEALDRCNLRLSPHCIAVLTSCPPPQSVQGLRSFIGAYKVLSCVLPNRSDLVDPLK